MESAWAAAQVGFAACRETTRVEAANDVEACGAGSESDYMDNGTDGGPDDDGDNGPGDDDPGDDPGASARAARLATRDCTICRPGVVRSWSHRFFG